MPLNAGGSKSLACGCSPAGGCDCWAATWCICFCCFCWRFNSFLSSKSFSLEPPTLSKSLSLSFDDCLWLFDSLRVAPRSAEAVPAMRSRLEADAEDFMPTECDGEIWCTCFEPDDVDEGLPPWFRRNSDFSLIIMQRFQVSRSLPEPVTKYNSQCSQSNLLFPSSRRLLSHDKVFLFN